MIKGVIAGCFDLIHPGYIMMFAQAKTQCDHLIVALQDDPTLDRPGKNKPVNTLSERFMILDSIKYVDKIVVYKLEKELENLFSVLSPDIRFLGDDYRDTPKNQITGYFKCKRLEFLPRSHGYSTTKLREKIVENHK